MNGFSAADMTTAASNGFRDGVAAQPIAAQEAVAWQCRYAKLAPDGSHYEWHEISREQYLVAANGKWASAYELRELYAAPVAAATAEFAISDGDRAVLQRLKCALPTAGVNGWAKGVEVLERILRTTVASIPTAPGIDLRRFLSILDRADAACMEDCMVAPGKTMQQEIAELRALINASPKGGSEWMERFIPDPKPSRDPVAEDDSDAQYNAGWNDCRELTIAAMQATRAEVGA